MITSVTAEVAYNTTVKSIKDTNLYREMQIRVYSTIDKSIKDNKFSTTIDVTDTASFDTLYPIMIVLKEELLGLCYNVSLLGLGNSKLILDINWLKSKNK